MLGNQDWAPLNLLVVKAEADFYLKCNLEYCSDKLSTKCVFVTIYVFLYKQKHPKINFSPIDFHSFISKSCDSELVYQQSVFLMDWNNEKQSNPTVMH